MRWELKTSNPSIAMEALRRVMVERFGDEAQRALALPEVDQFFEQLFEHLLPVYTPTSITCESIRSGSHEAN